MVTVEVLTIEMLNIVGSRGLGHANVRLHVNAPLLSACELCSLCSDQCSHAATTTINIISTCPKCGLIKKSGRLSCCARSGSWFGNCGSDGDTNFDHTWYEGLQACNEAQSQSQSRAVFDHQMNEAQEERDQSSYHANNNNAKAISTAAKPLVFTSEPMSKAPSMIEPDHMLASISTANAVLTINSNAITPKVITLMSAVDNVSRMIPNITSANATSGHTLTGFDLINVSKVAPAQTSVTSQGCEQLLDITICVTLSPIAVIFWR